MTMSNKHNNYYKPALSLLLFSSLIAIVSSCTTSSHEHHHGHYSFNYDEASGKGPSRWGLLNPKWRKCSFGRSQSPIDIRRAYLRPQLGDLEQNYTAAPAVLLNNTHLVEVLWKGYAGKIRIGRVAYNVDNVHWHSPSEHTVNGTRYDLELHLVHKTEEVDIAVVSILYKFGPPDPFLERLMPFITRLGEGSQNETVGNINPESIGFSGRGYYRYLGSLTTPPCTEGVTWTIFKQVKTVSRQQVEALKQVLPPQNRNNSRPTQALNGRPVYEYHP